MKRPHFALPEIYDDSLSYYDVLRKLIKSMHAIVDNLNKIPEQIANEAKAREQADGTLQTNIDNEKQSREQADQEIREGVSNKISELKGDLANKLPKSPGDWDPWTAEEQAMARKRIGEPQFELIEEITLTEDVKAIMRNTEPNGTPYNFDSVLIYTNAKIVLGEGSGSWGINLTNGNTNVRDIAFGDSIYESYTKQYLKIYNNHGFLDAESYQNTSNGYSSGYIRYPAAVRFNGLIVFDGITQIQIYQFNNKTFASGSVFKIYAIRR